MKGNIIYYFHNNYIPTEAIILATRHNEVYVKSSNYSKWIPTNQTFTTTEMEQFLLNDLQRELQCQ